MINVLMKCHLFKSITEQTLYQIVYDLAKPKTIGGGQLVHRMLKRSIFGEGEKKLSEYTRSYTKKTIEHNLISNNDCNKDLADVYFTSKVFHQRIGDAYINESEGLYIVISGKCEIKHPKDSYVVGIIQANDFFGESDFFKEMGYNYFGNIYTVKECKFLYLSHENLERIVEYDKKVLRVNAKKNMPRLTKMIFQCAELYGGNPYEIKY